MFFESIRISVLQTCIESYLFFETCYLFFLNLLPVYIKLVTCLMKDELLLLVLLHIIDKLATRLKVRRQHDMYRGIQRKS